VTSEGVLLEVEELDGARIRRLLVTLPHKDPPGAPNIAVA
jgi:hypothetical protein